MSDRIDCFRMGDTSRMRESIIVRDPEILGGEPVFRGTRVPYQALLDYLEGGRHTLDDFLEDFPTVTRDGGYGARSGQTFGACRSDAGPYR